MENVKLKVVWMITERGDKSFWTRIGSGFTNRDGSLSIQLDAIPMPGSRIQVRDYTPRDVSTDETNQSANPSSMQQSPLLTNGPSASTGTADPCPFPSEPTMKPNRRRSEPRQDISP